MENATVPSFYLFGEPPRPVGDQFLHLEDLDDRTRPNDWNIRPHVHANLNHVFHIARGGGDLRVESRVIPFSAPCLLLIPAGVVHGLSYEVETSGSVLTVSEAYLRELIRREPEFASLFAEPSCVPIARPAVVSDILSRLAREVSWEAPGHAAAVEALLMSLFVDALRRLAVTASARPALGPHAELVARFRARVEDRYRMGDTVEDYAHAGGQPQAAARRLPARGRRPAAEDPAGPHRARGQADAALFQHDDSRGGLPPRLRRSRLLLALLRQGRGNLGARVPQRSRRSMTSF